jgi:NAD(P)H-flavin reductase/hemoglobin-like flavoprotein
VVDPVRLKQSWASVAEHGDQVPLFFYSTLFLTEPDLRAMFPVSMASQRDRLVAALGQVISQVDNLEAGGPTLRQLGRDHRKFGVVAEHYPAVGRALLATLEHFSGPDWNDDVARDWSTAYGIVADVMIDGADAAADLPPWWDVTVTAIDRRTVDIAVLTVMPHMPLPYAAGQSVALEVPSRPRLWRYYTPATLPAPDGSFELHVRLVPGGGVSSAIVQNGQVGDVLRAGPPVGHRLTLASSAQRDLVLLAGGTGLAPMKAIIQQLAVTGDPRHVHLFWGVRQQRDLYDLAAMRALTDHLDGVRLVACASREPTPGPHVHAGQVVDVALQHGPWPDHEIYICGSPGMVRATRHAVAQAGTPPDLVHTDELGNEETLA